MPGNTNSASRWRGSGFEVIFPSEVKDDEGRFHRDVFTLRGTILGRFMLV